MSATDSPPAQHTRLPGARTITWLSAIGVVAVDIVSKDLALRLLAGPAEQARLLGGLLVLEVTRNSGAAFGIGRQYTAVIAFIAIAAVIAIVRAARKSRSRLYSAALGLILGGAVGNLIDRLARAPGLFEGRVVDWIHIAFLPFVFNLADAALTFGVIILFFTVLRSER